MPTVKELFRESISGHTCDRRGTRTYIKKSFPEYEIEKGFAKTDELWVEGMSEASVDQDIRSKAALDDVFDNDEGVYLSITSHSGQIQSLLRGEIPRGDMIWKNWANHVHSAGTSHI